MKTITVIKTIMGLMALLILAGFILIATKISEKTTNSKVKSTPPITNVHLSDEENVTSMTSCGDFVCLLITGQPRSSTLFVIDPASGSVLRTIPFNKSEK